MFYARKATFCVILAIFVGVFFVSTNQAKADLLSDLKSNLQWVAGNAESNFLQAKENFIPKPKTIIIAVPIGAQKAPLENSAVKIVPSIRAPIKPSTASLLDQISIVFKPVRQSIANFFTRPQILPQPSTKPTLVAKPAPIKIQPTLSKTILTLRETKTEKIVIDNSQLADLAKQLADLKAKEKADSDNLFQVISLTGRINNLGPSGSTPLVITSPTFSGTAQGLTDDSIPDDITIGSTKNGSFSKDLTVGGNFKANGNIQAGGVVIDSSGTISGIGSLTANVGISSSTPGAALAVKGAGIFDGFVSANYFTSTSTLNSWLLGNFGIGTSTIGNKLEVAGFGVVKGNFNIEATSTLSSVNATSTINVGTSTPGTNSQLSVSGNGYLTGGLGIGVATTSPGGLFVKGSADIYDGLVVRGGKIGITNDSNGLIAPAANTLAFQTNGSERARILSTGELAYGTAAISAGRFVEFRKDQNGTTEVQVTNATNDTTATAQLSVGGGVGITTGSLTQTYSNFTPANGLIANAFHLKTSTTGASSLVLLTSAAAPIIFSTNLLERARFLSTGELGIGTTTPGNKFEVAGGEVIKGITTIEDTGKSSRFLATTTLAVATTSPYGILSVDIPSTADAKTPAFVIHDNGTSTPSIYVEGGFGRVGIGTSSPQAQLAVELLNGSDPNNKSTAGFVVSSRGTSTPALYVSNANGNVGIGTSSPAATVGISANNSNPALLINQVGSGYILHVGSSHSLVVANNGNVGVGTAAPSDALDVEGLFRVGVSSGALFSVLEGVSGVDKGYIGIAGATNGVVSGSVVGDMGIRSVGNLLLSGDNGASIGILVNTSNVVTLKQQSVFDTSSGAAFNSLQNAGVAKAYYGIAGAPNGVISGSAINDFGLRGVQSILFSANDGASVQAALRSTGEFGIGTTTPGTLLDVAGFGNVKGNFNIAATSTLSSVNATSTVNVATSTPGTNTQLSVGGNGYISGGLSVGASATTSSGALIANFLSSNTRLLIKEQASCSGSTNALKTDANGVVNCGTVSGVSTAPAGSSGDVQFNNAGSTAGDSGLQYGSGALVLGNTLSLGGSSKQSALNLGNGLVATSTFTGQYGLLGFGSTTPFGQISVEAVQGVVGSSTPIFVIGDSGSSTPSIYVEGGFGRVGISTSSPQAQLAVELLNGSDPNNKSTAGFVVSSRGTSTPALYVSNANGNVGLGTAAPGSGLTFGSTFTTPLHVKGSGAMALAIQAIGSGNPAVLYAEGNTQAMVALTDSVAAGTNNKILDIQSSGGKMNFRRINDAYSASQATAMTIDYNANTNGNVGIGTSSPASVGASGTTLASTNLYVSGTTTVQEIKFDDYGSKLGSSTPNRNTLYADNIIKGWVHFDGTTAVIWDSFNVLSFTKNGTGDYTITWAARLRTAYYSAVCNSGQFAAALEATGAHNGNNSTECRVFNTANVATDNTNVNLIIIGRQ